RALLREVTDQFFGSPVRTPTEDILYGDVLSQLAEDMEEAVRAELAHRFADAPDAPHRLIRKLAEDLAVPVAGPVLEQSPVLTDDDLLAVVQTLDQGHLRAVPARSVVSEAISDVIVERGDDETLGALLKNEGATLSRGASETAVSRAKANPRLHAA